jgi:hypothetical protein
MILSARGEYVGDSVRGTVGGYKHCSFHSQSCFSITSTRYGNAVGCCWLLALITFRCAFYSDAHLFLVRLLDSPDPEIVAQAWWALGNIAGDGMSRRNMLLGMGLASRCASTIEASNY